MIDESVLFARQSIYDTSNTIVAHEILYRGSALSTDSEMRDAQATRELLINVCTSVINENVNLDQPMLINIDQRFLLADDFFPIAPQNLVFELLETIEPTEDVIKKIAQLRRQGFEFALDDYVLEDSKRPFFKYLKIIKVDVLDVDWNSLPATMSALKKTKCLLLAEKVQDAVMFQKCKDLGFDLFQGYYLEKPVLISGKQLTASKQKVLQLVAQFSRSDVEVSEVASLISQDPVLTFKILALVNCPLYQLVRDIKSVKDAVVILGLKTVKQWALILTLVDASEQPKELFRTLLIRAKTIENYLGSSDKNSDASEGFLVGLLSGISAVFETELESILVHLKLDKHITSALLGESNKLGDMLKNTIGIEQFDSQVFEQLPTQVICQYNRCYREAMKWADEVMNHI